MSDLQLPICITIDTDPVPWKAHGGYGRRSFNPRFLEKEFYQLQIRRQYHHNLPITVAVKVEYLFFLPVPKASFVKQMKMLQGRIKHIKRPDTSNLVKFAEDTLKGIVIKDDSQVTLMTAIKIYSDKPRTEIKIDLA